MSEESGTPLSLRWVALFMESINRALDGAVYSWELKSQADPLSWVLIVTMTRPFFTKEVRFLREQLRLWAQINDAVYQRSTWEKFQFKGLLLLRGLGPLMNIDPYNDNEVDLDLFRRRRGGLWCPRRQDAGSRRVPSDQPAQETPDRVLADVLGQGFEEDDGPSEGETEDGPDWFLD